jgi:hypothetical protein
MTMSKQLTLSNDIRLNITVVVLAGPHKAAGRFQGLGDHVVNQTVLVPDLLLLKLLYVLPGDTSNIKLNQIELN